jgi:pimeloyl-ACP methyl ester carboxylesterase
VETPARWLLLHGTPLSPAVWDGVAAELRRRARVDCAETTLDAGCSTTRALAERLVSGWLPAGERVHVAGHSFGGQVALDMALLAPERVASLVLVCSRDTPFPPFSAAADALRRGDPVDTEATLARWFRDDELEADGPVVRYARDRLDHADREEWALALSEIATFDRSGEVAGLDVPVTLIAAEHDPVSTPEAMADLAGRLPRATLHVHQGARHMTPYADPVGLAGLLRGS